MIRTRVRTHVFLISAVIVLGSGFAFTASVRRIPRAFPRTLIIPAQSPGLVKIESPPLFREYRGVHLGMSAEETRKKLGEPTERDDKQDLYTLSEVETAMIYYDEARKVYAISVTYVGAGNKAPTSKVILGEDLQAKPDGSMYKLTRYPKAGYWVSYTRTSGDDPLTIVAMQKMQP